ncbi:MAG TPA: helix-turn-helix transcriptional regulator [Thermoanaerobaculia bacterium]|nr:helix-turn-helix transcriptional regulator [Thermoanaerobaculia bacterium]
MRTVDESRILSLVRQIYEAVEAPDGWDRLLSALSSSLDAHVGTLDVYDTARKEGNLAASVNLDPRFGLTYAAHFAAKNLWLNHSPHLIRPGRPLTGQMLVPDDVLSRSEFYQDFLRHENLFHLAGARILEKGTLTAHLSLFRPRDREPFGEEELALLDSLLPHLQQAIRLTRRLSEVDALANLSRSVLDRLPIGTLLLDRSGRVAVMNRTAEEIMALKDGLAVTPCGLKAASRKEDEALTCLVRRTTSAAQGKGLWPGGILRVPRPSFRRAFLVEVVPYGAHMVSGDGGCVAVAVFVSDPEAFPAPSHVGCAYGLTVAEEALTVHLAKGETLESAAEALEVSLNTARTHLKHIFAKTGVKRQSDLVRLVLTGITGLRPTSTKPGP